jgi:hypothetical protein
MPSQRVPPQPPGCGTEQHQGKRAGERSAACMPARFPSAVFCIPDGVLRRCATRCARGALGRFWGVADYREARRVERIGAESDLVAVVVPVTVAVRRGRVGPDGDLVGIREAVGVAVIA